MLRVPASVRPHVVLRVYPLSECPLCYKLTRECYKISEERLGKFLPARECCKLSPRVLQSKTAPAHRDDDRSLNVGEEVMALFNNKHGGEIRIKDRPVENVTDLRD